MVSREKIIQKVNQYNLFEFVETSALENTNVDLLFNRLSICSLLELKPRLGEVAGPNHFRFKVLLAGAAAVGKSSLIKTFVKKEFNHDYKITVGLDFMTRDFEIANDDLPDEVHEIINNAVGIEVENKKHRAKIKAELNKLTIETSEEIESVNRNEVIPEKGFKSTYIYIALSLIFGVLIATLIIHIVFSI